LRRQLRHTNTYNIDMVSQLCTFPVGTRATQGLQLVGVSVLQGEGAVVLGHGLGALGDGVLAQLAREEQADSSL
jgi:hypothetical protein